MKIFLVEWGFRENRAVMSLIFGQMTIGRVIRSLAHGCLMALECSGEEGREDHW